MFNILLDTDTPGEKLIIIRSANSQIRAVVDLTKGASLSKLVFDGCEIISPNARDYFNSFDSAILFPFSNRIEGSKYEFKGEEFHLKKNFKQENIAIHGLIYNKEFEIEKTDLTEDEAIISLKLKQTEREKGFPYLYSIRIIYRLSANHLKLEVEVVNNDLVEFPFSLGWHPYFRAKNLSECFLTMDAEHFNLNADEQLRSKSELDDSFQIKNKKFDDCFRLNNNEVIFESTDYKMKLSSGQNMFLQLFTPNSRDSLAIEPMTAPPNSLNNKINLHTLAPNQRFNLYWQIAVTTNTSNN